MSAGRREFGVTLEGEAVEAIELAAGALRAEVLSYGASLRDLRLDGVTWPLTLGLNSTSDYVQHSPHFGAIAGRVANRIAGGRFEIDGAAYHLPCNENAKNTLHGGERGFGIRVWRVEEHGADFVALEYRSDDGEEGFPGCVEVRCLYRLIEPSTLRLELSARCDAPTLVNLAPHGYLNLDGTDSIDRHCLQIAADAVTVVDADLIPTGAVEPVSGSRFDFRESRLLGDVAYDCNFCLASAPRPEPAFAARLTAGELALRIDTTEPGLQLYTGDKLNVPVPGVDGRHYGPRAGLCLEPQRWPDAPHHRHFPSILLRPGESYRQETVYLFERFAV